MEDTSGFYKADGDKLMWAPNFVDAPTFTLHRDAKDEHTYPVEGWSWFDNEQEARQFFNLPPSA